MVVIHQTEGNTTEHSIKKAPCGKKIIKATGYFFNNFFKSSICLMSLTTLK